jgi:hypothetical protein
VAGDVAALLSFALARNREEAVEAVRTGPAADGHSNATGSSSSSSSSSVVRSKDEILLQAVVPGATSTSTTLDGECLAMLLHQFVHTKSILLLAELVE